METSWRVGGHFGDGGDVVRDVDQVENVKVGTHGDILGTSGAEENLGVVGTWKGCGQADPGGEHQAGSGGLPMGTSGTWRTSWGWWGRGDMVRDVAQGIQVENVKRALVGPPSLLGDISGTSGGWGRGERQGEHPWGHRGDIGGGGELGDVAQVIQVENVKRALVGHHHFLKDIGGGGDMENVEVGTHGDVLGTLGVVGTWPR